MSARARDVSPAIGYSGADHDDSPDPPARHAGDSAPTAASDSSDSPDPPARHAGDFAPAATTGSDGLHSRPAADEQCASAARREGSSEAEASRAALVEFAPAVIVRAACWPTRALEALADPELAACAAAADAGDAVAVAGYSAVYLAALSRARALLWDQTGGDLRFMRALTVSNPEFAQRVARLQRDARRNKRVRHTETSLYRYLARAVGRTEPCELWSGVALASWAARTRVQPAAPRVLFTPDLRPFQRLLRALGRTPAYHTRGSFKTAVTLTEHGDGRWSYWVRPGDRPPSLRWLQPKPGLHVLLGVVQGLPAQPFDALVGHVCERVALEPESARRALLALLDAGVLTGGIDLPSRFVSAWDALAESSALLAGEHRRAWLKAYRVLRRICRRLERVHDLPPVTIAAHLTDASEAIRRLAAALELDCPALPRVALRADMQAPFAIALGPEQRAAVSRALADYQRHQAAYGVAHALRQAALQRSCQDSECSLGAPQQRVDLLTHTPRIVVRSAEAVDAGPDAAEPLSWEDHVAPAAQCASVRQRIDRWQKLLAGEGPVIAAGGADPPPGSPFGCVLFSASAPGLAVHGLLDEFTPLYARYPRLWSPGPQPVDDPLLRWFRAAIARVERDASLTIAELVTPCEANPNVLARPAFTDATLSVWTAREHEAEIPLAGARLVRDPRSRTLLLHCPARVAAGGTEQRAADPPAAPVAVFSFSSAHVAHDDPVGQRLLTTAFRVVGMANVHTAALPFACELSGTHASPRVELPGGEVVRTRRTVLSGSALKQLLQEAPAVRYARIQRLAAQHAWTAIVRVRRDQEAALLVPVSSPLALEALFEGAASTHVLTIEDCDQPWLRDADGRGYIAEFAAPFLRTEHAWSPRRASP